jgi:hypothetical protein
LKPAHRTLLYARNQQHWLQSANISLVAHDVQVLRLFKGHAHVLALDAPNSYTTARSNIEAQKSSPSGQCPSGVPQGILGLKGTNPPTPQKMSYK